MIPLVDHVSREMRDLFDFIYGNGAPFKEPVRPRDLTDQDRLEWDIALDSQPRGKPKTLEQARAILKARNRLRWWGMQRDYKWLQKEMLKMGLNPEDARFML